MTRHKNNKMRFNKVLKLCDPVKVCDESIGGCSYTQPKFTKSGLRILAEFTDKSYD